MIDDTIKATVTLPVEEYDRLRELEKAIEESRVIVYSGYYNDTRYLSESDAISRIKSDMEFDLSEMKDKIKRLEEQIDYQNDWIGYLLNRNIIQRIFNVDNFKPLSER